MVPVDGRPRPAITAAPGRTVVGRTELARAVDAVADRRRARLRERIAQLEGELRAAERHLAEADVAVAQRRADRDGFADAAAWCDALPEASRRRAAEVTAAEAELADALRASREAGRALDRVLDQRASADAAIAEARRQLDALRSDLPGDPEREQAAARLAAQAESVEARLREAEAEARGRCDQAKRAVSELERELERLVRDQRERLNRLADLVECLPGEARPPAGDEPLAHAAGIAAGLRALAAVVDGEVAGLGAEADRRRADCDARRRQVDAVRASLDRIAPEDAAEAIAELVTGVADGVVVFDDLVATAPAADADGLLRALEATEAAAPIVLLSSDPTVLGWAIDLPADRGALVGPAVVDALVELPSADTPTAHALATQHASTATGDHP